ncbi:hypothetical protein Trydic_g4409 [Trypoxylus dichotomus]
MLSNTEPNLENLNDVLIALENESILLKKVQYMEHIVSNYLLTIVDINIDVQLLCTFMPQVKTVLEMIFEKLIETTYDANNEEVCTQTLKSLQEYLQMIMMLFDVLGEIFNFITAKNKIDYVNVISLPLNTVQMLYLTFLHCKESNNIYKAYFESLNEVLMVFKKAQDIHAKLLNLLDNCLIYNISCETEIVSLGSVLDTLAEIGDVLSGMNVKSMADNWKSYMNITQKYADNLSNCLNLERPLIFCTNEIVKSMNNILELNMCDSRNITHTLKISNFILRVMMKLCDIFSKEIVTHMDIFWNFFINFYSIYFPAVKSKRFSENTIDLIRSLICNSLEDLLNKVVQFEGFYDVHLLESLISNADSALGFIMVSNKVLQKLVSNHSNKITGVNIVSYLDMIFTATTKCK